MKAEKTFAYQKCAVHSRQPTPVSQWSVSRTHTAQEIKAVNKGRSDKESPDSYESRAGLGLPPAHSGRVRMGMKKQITVMSTKATICIWLCQFTPTFISAFILLLLV